MIINDAQSTGDSRMEWNSRRPVATLFNTQPKIMKIIEKQWGGDEVLINITVNYMKVSQRNSESYFWHLQD